jgi:hypothetical protein
MKKVKKEKSDPNANGGRARNYDMRKRKKDSEYVAEE